MGKIKINKKVWNDFTKKDKAEGLSILEKGGFWESSDELVLIDNELKVPSNNSNAETKILNYDSDETDEERREREERKRRRYNECRQNCDDKYASAKYACDINSNNPVSKAACLALANAKWADCVAYCEIAVGRP